MTPETSKTANLLKAAIAALGIAFLVMSIASVLLGYKWMQEKNLNTNLSMQVYRLEEKIDELKDENKESQKQLKECRDQLNESPEPLKKSRDILRKSLDILDEFSEEPEEKSEEPKKPKTKKQKPSGQDDVPSEEPSIEITLPKVLKKVLGIDGNSDTSHSDKPNNDNGPQVDKDVGD